MSDAKDFDSPWKELLHEDLRPFLAFFHKDIHDDLDWASDHESLEQELRSTLPDSPRGRRVADKLIKTQNLAGDRRNLHIEIQGRKERAFRRRVHVYNYRAEDGLGGPVVSMVVLLDRSPTWRPRRYTADLYGCKRILTFRCTKILDRRGREEELRSHENPVALFVLAALTAMFTKRSTPARETVKLDLIALLRQKNMETVDAQRWSRYFDWLLPLTPEAEKRVLARTRELEEPTMPYVTSWEKIGREEGKAAGKIEGKAEGILSLLPTFLKDRYGDEGSRFAEQAHHLPADKLSAIVASVVAGASLDDLRKLL